MPKKQTMTRTRQAARAGKSPSTQAGTFVQEKLEHLKRRAKRITSRREAIAIGLSKTRKVGVTVPVTQAPTRPSRSTNAS